MKTIIKSILHAALAALALAAPLAPAQNVIWDYTALGAAPATNDKLFLYDTSATASKTMTIANLFTSPALTSPTITTSIVPASDDGAALGSSSAHFSDLFIASGGVLNFNNGNVAVTHSSGILTMGTGELRITTVGTNAASVPTLGSTSTLTNKTLTSPVLGGSITGTYTLAGTPTITSPTISAPVLSGTATGTYTLGGTPTIAAAVLSGSFTGTYTLAGTPTITSPTISSPTMTTPVLGVATGTSLAVTGALSTSSAATALGYATGAGGAVTQATSRTTGVTISPNPATSGTITTTADSMAAQTPTTFTVTNSAVSATDSIIITKVSGDADTHAWVNSVGSGSFTVTLFNTHASAADTTAFVFNFAVINGVAN